MRLLAATSVVCLLACVGPAVPFPEVPEPDGLGPISERVGLAANLALGSTAEAQARRRGQLERLASTGIRRLRVDFSWHRLEKRQGQWDFAQHDAMVGEAKDAGVRLLGLLAYGNPVYPSQAGGGGTALPTDDPPEVFYPPIDAAHYATYVGKLVAHYRGTVADWELWNEQNIGYRFWRPSADAATYAQFVAKASVEGRRACPECRFVLGGLSMPQPVPELNLYPVGPVFLKDAYRADPDLAAHVDAIAFHPYQYPKEPPEKETAPFRTRRQGSLASQTRQLDELVAGQRSPRPLWVTENGWSTNPGIPQDDPDIARVFGLEQNIVALARHVLGEADFQTVLETARGVSEEDQARYLVRSVLLGCALRIERTYLFTLDDSTHEPEINQEAAFGMFRTDGSEKPAVAALKTLVQTFGDVSFAADLSSTLGPTENDRALAFRGDGRLLLAAWRWQGAPSVLRLGPLPGSARLVGQDGTTRRRFARGDHVELPLGVDVTYLEVSP